MCFSRFKFACFKFTGRYKKQTTSKFVNEINVSKEYKEALRTNSYIEICHKVQGHIGLDKGLASPSSSISSSPTHDHCIRQYDILFEPQKETMASLNRSLDIHCLLLDFFDAGLEGWKACEKLLQSIHHENANHQRIERVIKIAERVPESDQPTTMYKELASYSSLANPLLDFSPEEFPQIHNHLKLLLKRLNTNRTMIKRKRKLIICLKKALGCALVASYTILAFALLVLAFHGLVGIVASPGLIACSFGLTKKAKAATKGLKTDELKQASMLLDVAAKGIYMLIKDFDTIGSFARRLQDEVEFGRSVARNCVGNLKHGVLEEVMREFRAHESRCVEQLEEFKDHIYLCLLNVNRSRRLLMQEILPCSYKDV